MSVSTKLPNPIQEFGFPILGFITIPCLKFCALYWLFMYRMIYVRIVYCTHCLCSGWFLYSLFMYRLIPVLPVLPDWTMYCITAPCFLYPLISPIIFACRNQKIRKEIKLIYQVNNSFEKTRSSLQFVM